MELKEEFSREWGVTCSIKGDDNPALRLRPCRVTRVRLVCGQLLRIYAS
jgi:hypothetical protein